MGTSARSNKSLQSKVPAGCTRTHLLITSHQRHTDFIRHDKRTDDHQYYRMHAESTNVSCHVACVDNALFQIKLPGRCQSSAESVVSAQHSDVRRPIGASRAINVVDETTSCPPPHPVPVRTYFSRYDTLLKV